MIVLPRVLGLGVALGAMVLSGCHASTGGGEPGYPPAGAGDKEPPCYCAPSIPATGMYCIGANLDWREGVLSPGSPDLSMRYWRASVKTADGKRISLVAGAISPVNEGDPARRGVVPPGVVGFAPGLALQQCAGRDSSEGCLSEITTLRGGFLHARVERDPGMIPRFGYAWPFIVRTPSLPAGTYSGVFVLLAAPGGMGGDMLREVVYRPNQEPRDCNRMGDPDNVAAAIAQAQPYAGSTLHLLKSPGFVEVTPLGASQSPQTIGPDDARFLSDVCRFVQSVERLPMPSKKAQPLPCTRP